MSSNGLKFTHSAHIAPKIKPKNKQAHWWGMLAAGLSCGLLGMYFTITRPMTERMRALEADLAIMQTEMHQLVGTRDDLWKTNDLLTGLRHQQRQLAEAGQSLAALRDMKHEVIALADQHQQAMQQLAAISRLQSTLVANSAAVEEAEVAIGQVQELQQAVTELGKQSLARQSQIAAAQGTLLSLDDLTSQTIKQQATVEAAQSMLKSVDKLSGSLLGRGEALARSSEVVQQMDALQSQIAQQSEKLPVAIANWQEIAGLHQELAAHDPKLTAQAERNLIALQDLGTDLSTGSDRITSAVQTIELLEDFQSQMQVHANTLTNMRRELMEIAFLESTVKQTLQVLKPLIQLTDMRRMSDREVREAARVIMDRRIADSRLNNDEPAPSKLAGRDEMTPLITPKQTGGEQKVPVPTDLE